jgi:uncharacterized protein (TIGR03437 family)
LIVNYSQDFLDRYLQRQNNATSKLLTTGANWDTYWRTGGVPDGSYQPGMPAAPMGLASIKGDNLTSITDNPPGQPTMPQQIDGVTVTLTPASAGGRLGGGGPGAGATYHAFMYGISPTQINFVVPPETPADIYTVTASLNGSVVASGPISVASIAPGLFATASGTAAGWAQRASGIVPIYTNAPVPLDVSQDPTYLVLWGTGFRSGLNLAAYIAASPEFQGIDQIAIGPLPASLAGRGFVPVQITVGAQMANQVGLDIQ